MHPRTRKTTIGAGLVAAALVAGGLLPPAATAAGDPAGKPRRVTAVGELNPLNNSGVAGMAVVHVKNRRLNIRIEASGLAATLPHAQHIHHGAQARHECPTVADDTNGDFRLTVSEGAPAYGGIRTSLTTRGDTSPASALAVKRFPTAPKGELRYHRRITTDKQTARAVRRGEAVVVIHGVDYNTNGQYDFDSAGPSDINPDLPAEATDPAACGVLHRSH